MAAATRWCCCSFALVLWSCCVSAPFAFRRKYKRKVPFLRCPLEEVSEAQGRVQHASSRRIDLRAGLAQVDAQAFETAPATGSTSFLGTVSQLRTDWKAMFDQLQKDLKADFNDVSGAFLKRDFGAFASRPHEVAGWIFTIFFFLHFVKIIVFEWLSVENFEQKRTNMQKSRQQFFHGPMHDMMTKLNALRQSEAYPAEFHFQVRHRELLSFLHSIVKTRTLSDNNSLLVEPFREFMSRWLSIFEQCSASPEEKPYILCPADKLARATSVAGIAKIVSRAAMGNQPVLAGPCMNAANNLHRECTQGNKHKTPDTPTRKKNKKKDKEPWLRPVCGCTITWARRDQSAAFPIDIYIFCMKLTLLSFGHAMLLGFYFFGLGLATLLHMTGRHFTGLCVDLALGLISITLYNESHILENRALDVELELLETQIKDVDKYHAQLVKWKGEYDRAGLLWRYQTMHMLDMFEAVAGLIREWSHEHNSRDEEPVMGRLDTLNEKLQAVVDGMGSPTMYLDSGFIKQHWWPEVSEHIQRSIGLIREAADLGELADVVRYLDNFFGLIVVRVIGAKKLPNTDGGMFAKAGDLTDGFVFVRLEGVRRELAPKTAVINDDLNPRWDEEFCLMIREETYVTLEVFDFNEDAWMAAPQQAIGFARSHFRSSAGRWVKKQEKLRTLTNGKQMESTLEFQLFFANCVQHLVALEAEEIEANSLESVGHFLSGVPTVDDSSFVSVGVTPSMAMGAAPSIGGRPSMVGALSVGTGRPSMSGALSVGAAPSSGGRASILKQSRSRGNAPAG